MIAFPALSLAAVLLVADPVAAPDAVPVSKAEQLATQLGRTIGAARQCALGERADAALTKATGMVDQAAAEGSEDSLDMNDRLHEAISEGRNAVLDGTTSCDRTRIDLDRLEGKRGQ